MSDKCNQHSTCGAPLSSSVGPHVHTCAVVAALLLVSAGVAAEVIPLSDTDHLKERRIVERLAQPELAEAKAGKRGEVSIEIGVVDLNGDGVNEIIARFVAPYFCGSHGCSAAIYTFRGSSGWTDIGKLISHGLFDVHTGTAGTFRPISLGGSYEFKFDGKTYK